MFKRFLFSIFFFVQTSRNPIDYSSYYHNHSSPPPIKLCPSSSTLSTTGMYIFYPPFQKRNALLFANFVMHHHKLNYLLLASSTFCARPTPPYRTTSPKPARSKDRKSKSFRSRTPEHHQTRDTRPNVIN